MSETAVGDLAAWLTQIWDEDEERLREIHRQRCGTPEMLTSVDTMGRPFQTACECDTHIGHSLARIAADRQILADYIMVKEQQEENAEEFVRLASQAGKDQDRFSQVKTFGWEVKGRMDGLRAAVRSLASAYADRPGYREEWKP